MSTATLSVPIRDISELPEDHYVGLIDPDAVACLSVRLAAEGLLTPIWLRRNGNAAKSPWSVIAGRHRLRAAIQLGWTEIDATERAGTGSKPDELRRLQIAENLDRRVLRPIERACFIMERARHVVAVDGQNAAGNQQSRAAAMRWSACDTVSHAVAIDAVIATACGCDPRTIKRYRRLHIQIVAAFPGQFAQLNAHPLGESFSAMTKIAQIKREEARRRAIETVLSRPDWKSMEEALVAASLKMSTGNRVDPNHPDARFWNDFRKMNPVRQRANIRALANEVTPSIALEFVEVLKERKIIRDNITLG